MEARLEWAARAIRRVVIVLLILAATARADEPGAAAVAGFNAYVAKLEARLDGQHRSAAGFVTLPGDFSKLRRGELAVEKLTPENGSRLQGAMLHHWRGTAFVPGARAADLERLLRDFPDYPRRYAPQVLSAKVTGQPGDHYRVAMRVRQKHVLTVVMDTSYEVTFAQLDARHGSSASRSTQVAEIDGAGTARERALGPGEEHGFLWRMNSYWSWEERDGGVYMQIESVSLTRSIPVGLGWAIGPFVDSVPRESLEFTLRATRDAVKR